MTQTEINACSKRKLEEADAALDAAYRRYRVLLSGGAVETLDRAQKAWEVYRDAHCDAAYEKYEGGTMAPSVLAGCREHLATQRLQALKAAYDEPPLPPTPK